MKNISNIVRKNYIYILIFVFVFCVFCYSVYIDNNIKVLQEYSSQIYAKINNENYKRNEFIELCDKDGTTNDSFNPIEVEEFSLYGDNKDIDLEVINKFRNIKSIYMRDCRSKKIIIENNSIETLELENITVKNLEIYSNSIQEIKLKDCKIDALCVNVPNLEKLNLDYTHKKNDNYLNLFYECIGIKELSIRDNPNIDIKDLDVFEKLESLNLLECEIESYESLTSLTMLNEIYINKEVNRECLDFMSGNFKQGDVYTRVYFATNNHKK